MKMEKPSREEYTDLSTQMGGDAVRLYVEALEAYCKQLEKALDKACKELSSHTVECDLVQCPFNCEYDSCDFDCGNTQKWKEWCMRDEEDNRQ